MKKKKLYSYELEAAVNKALPERVLEAFRSTGWNALGVYEMVLDEIKKEKKRLTGE